MMLSNNIKMSLASIRRSKWRSLLTMLGIIVGVVSVVTTVSLGEGVKHQVTGQIDHLGRDLITIRPGRLNTSNKGGLFSSVGFNNELSSSNLTEKDVGIIKSTPGVHYVAPYSLINGIVSGGGRQMDSAYIIATSPDLPAVINQKILYGGFFGADETNKQIAIIGQKVAENLFQENVPIGKIMKIHGREIIVEGIFTDFDTSPLTPGVDLNSAIFIPYAVGKDLNNGNAQIYQILVKPEDSSKTDQVIASIKKALVDSHGGQEDLSILRQSETLAIANNILNLITQLIAGIAAISLIVGGIGIMNIMLVSVTERTHEIGIRKAVGATNRQILRQFLTEAAVLSFVGGIIGVFLSVVTNFLIRIFTNLQPVITLQVVLLSTFVSLAVGIVFGIMPAMRAARKDPIEALRYE